MNDNDVIKQVGMVSPNESVLAHNHCDFMKGYWTGQSMFNIPLTNWGIEPVVFDKSKSVDTVSVVDMDDDVWKEESSGIVAVVSTKNGDREKLLKAQLDIGEDCTPEQRAAMVKLMKKRHNVFALSNKELR